MELSRPEYRSGLLFPSPGDLPKSGIKPRSHTSQANYLPYEQPGKPISSVQSLSHVQLFPTPWTAPRQASLSITNSWSSPKLMPSSRWCHPAISSSVIPFSSCLENPWTEEPGGLQSMGSQRVGHDWATSLSLYCYERHSHVFSRLFLMATLKRSNCFHSADKETEAHMLADVVLGILTPSLGLLPLYDVSLLFLLKVHSKAATLPLAGKKQCA